MVSERWIPILAAVVGLLGGIGGAAIGGSIANEGQDQRIKDERIAERNNLLLDTYSRYLRTAAKAYVVIGSLSSDADADKVKVAGEVLSGEAEVRLVTDDEEVEATATSLNEAVVDNRSQRSYEAARNAFIEAAGQSLAPERAFSEYCPAAARDPEGSLAPFAMDPPASVPSRPVFGELELRAS